MQALPWPIRTMKTAGRHHHPSADYLRGDPLPGCPAPGGFGATLLTADAENDGAENHSDLTLTDDPAQAQTDTLLLAADIDGFEEYAPQRIRANFNLTDALIDAILLLIERQMAVTEPPAQCEYAENTPLKIDNNPFKSKDYYSLFLDTVPADVQKLYTESDQQDWPSLALTAHRLKGSLPCWRFPPVKGCANSWKRPLNATMRNTLTS